MGVVCLQPVGADEELESEGSDRCSAGGQVQGFEKMEGTGRLEHLHNFMYCIKVKVKVNIICSNHVHTCRKTHSVFAPS
jgi:hypothetical protein